MPLGGNPREDLTARTHALDLSQNPHQAQNAGVSRETGHVRFLRLSEVRTVYPTPEPQSTD